MLKPFEAILFDTDLALDQSDVIRDDPSRFVVRSRVGPARIVIALLFGIPCLALIYHALLEQGVYLVLAPVFCPPLAILSILYGFAVQQKTFTPSLGRAVKSYRLFHIQREMATDLPTVGVVSTYERFSVITSGSGGVHFHYAAVDGMKGFGFSVAKDKRRRDEFVRELADFLHYEIRSRDADAPAGAR